MRLYKLVDSNWITHGGMQWAIGKTNRATGRGNKLCTDGVLHAYTHPLVALLLNPIHANIHWPILLEVEAPTVVANDCGLKVGAKEMTPVRQMDVPDIRVRHLVNFAAYCALYKHPGYESFIYSCLAGRRSPQQPSAAVLSIFWDMMREINRAREYFSGNILNYSTSCIPGYYGDTISHGVAFMAERCFGTGPCDSDMMLITCAEAAVCD